jgi:hypothetical protein
MKYNIEGFDQQTLVNMGLNSNDAIILRWFVDFYGTNKMAEVTDCGKTYKWVKYQAVIDDLPILRITNKQVIARHFHKMQEAGILEKYLKKEGGVYTCFRLTEKYNLLIEKLNGINSKVETPINSKVETKDSSIKINPSIKTNADKSASKNFKTELLAMFQTGNKELRRPDFYMNGREAKSLDDLVKRFLKQEEPEQFAKKYITTFFELINYGKTAYYREMLFKPSLALSQWDNVLAGMVGGEDVQELIRDFFDS